MNKLTLTLVVALGISLLVNALAIERLTRAPEEARKPKISSAPLIASADPASPEPEARSSDEKLDRLIREMTQLRHDVEALKHAPPAVTAGPGPATPKAGGTSGTMDPKIAEVLGEQEQYDQFTRDLKKINGARSQVDEATYLKSVGEFTADYLGLVDPVKARFAEAVKQAAADVAVLAANYKSERDAIKWDPADLKGSRDRFEALTQNYQAQLRPVTNRMTDLLDPSQARSKQFSTNVNQWVIRNIAPEGFRLDRGPWGGRGFGD